MVSPFRRRQQLVRGLMSGAIAAPVTPATPAAPDISTSTGQEYAALRVLLHDNLRALKDVQSHEARVPMKAEFAKAFSAWIEGVLAAGEQGGATQDEIVTTNMLWAVDYSDVDYALKLGTHALRFHLAMPDGFTRTPACFLTEDIAGLSLSRPDAVSHDQLLALLALVDSQENPEQARQDMPDQVRAKLHKALGRSFERKAEAFDPAADNAPAGGKAAFIAEALQHSQRALELDRNAGVKKDIERLTRQLKDLGGTPAEDS